MTKRALSQRLICMGTFVLRSLSATCCLVLLLPPGWCSIVCAPVVESKGEGPKKTHGGCCDLCPCQDREKPPAEPNKPAPPSRCCCYELDWLKPKPPPRPVVDLSLFAFVTPADRAPTSATVRHELDLSIPVPSPPVHVLKCVWLC